MEKPGSAKSSIVTVDRGCVSVRSLRLAPLRSTCTESGLQLLAKGSTGHNRTFARALVGFRVSSWPRRETHERARGEEKKAQGGEQRIFNLLPFVRGKGQKQIERCEDNPTHYNLTVLESSVYNSSLDLFVFCTWLYTLCLISTVAPYRSLRVSFLCYLCPNILSNQ